MVKQCISYEEMMQRTRNKSKKSGPTKFKKFSPTGMNKTGKSKSFCENTLQPRLTPNQAARLYWFFLGQKYNFIDFNKKTTSDILSNYEANFINKNEKNPNKLGYQILYYYRDLRLVSYYNNFGPLITYKPISYTDEEWENLILKTGVHEDIITEIYEIAKETLDMDEIGKLIPSYIPDTTFKFK